MKGKNKSMYTRKILEEANRATPVATSSDIYFDDLWRNQRQTQDERIEKLDKEAEKMRELIERLYKDNPAGLRGFYSVVLATAAKEASK